MNARVISLLMLTLVAVLLPSQLSPQVLQEYAVRPAQVERMQNLELKVATSHRPAYIPREWGRLVAVEEIGNSHYVLFLEAENGNIFVVRLIQNGDYLYLDTHDQGGVTLVIQREP